MDFKQYLSQKVAPSTASRYQREINHFFFSIERKKNSVKTASYHQITNYIGERRKQYKSNSSVACTLHAIKHYYAYLVQIKEREDNPASSIQLRDKQSRDIQLQDLFTTKELEQLLDRNERYLVLKNRNKIILSLLIYQGLTNAEICGLKLNNLDLEKGTVFIKKGRKTNARTLKLQSKQVFWLMEYLQKDRLKLLKERSDKLIVSKLGTAEKGEGISYLVETLKYLFPKRNLNPRTIRQSVIANLLKQGHDLRLVQAFAGHKYPSATEKYKQTHLEELKNQVLKFHPLK